MLLEALSESGIKKPQHEMFADENDMDLLFRPPTIGASFQLGAWMSCQQEEETKISESVTINKQNDDNGDDDDGNDCHLSPCNSCEGRDSDDDSTDQCVDNDKSTPKSVSFCDNPQVRYFAKILPEEWGLLYYSCHEMQKFAEEHKKELVEKQIAEQSLQRTLAYFRSASV
jgi:hypothetical protein